jgi:hypothetical protein
MTRSGSPKRRLQLAEAQDWFCPICGGNLRFGDLSTDHVWSRRGLGRGLRQNHLAAHARCNNHKGSRRPTGCELVWLMVVNARLGQDRPPHPRDRPHRRRHKGLPLPTLGDLFPQV